MKKITLLFLLFAVLISGCAAEAEPAETTAEGPGNLQLGNPWSAYDTLEAAESASGLKWPLPETVAGSYQAESFRVMSGSVLEVIYRDQNFEVVVRLTEGEGQDISGVYTAYPKSERIEYDNGLLTVQYGAEDGSCLHLISGGGYSCSLYAPNGYWGDSCADFLNSAFRDYFGIQ